MFFNFFYARKFLLARLAEKKVNSAWTAELSTLQTLLAMMTNGIFRDTV